MLQVTARHAAQHPTAYPESELSANMHHHHLPSLQLPRTLAKPPFMEVSRDAICAIEPNLAAVPFEYIRKGLWARADELSASLHRLPIPQQIAKAHLPSSFELPYSPNTPSIILAISSSTSNSDAALLVPAHQLVLAANCAGLPRLPPPRHTPRSNGMVPTQVVPIQVPDEHAFIGIHNFLVSRRLDRFIHHVIPVPAQMITLSTGRPGSSTSNPLAHLSAPALATYLAQNAQGDRVSALMGLAKYANNVWRTACSLGVYDKELWAAMDFSWEVILGALNMVLSGQV